MASYRSARQRDDDTVRFPLILFLVSFGLAFGALYIDRPEQRPEALAQFRADATNILMPVYQFIDAPVRGIDNVGPWWRRQFELAEENRELQIEIAELRAWRDVAQSLQETNARYRDALNLRTPAVGQRISAWSVADQSSEFIRSRLIGAGRAQGVEPGAPVVNVYGLIGRTVEVGESSTRVLLLTDFNSRISVMADRSNARALMVGDNSEFPRLDYVGRSPDLREGDRIVTSGDDNSMPRGLPVGEARLDRDGQWRVVPFSSAAPVDLVWVWPFQPILSPEDNPVQPLPPSSVAGQTVQPEAPAETSIAQEGEG